MTAIALPTTASQTAAAGTVEVRSSWASAWVSVDDLYCDSLTATAAPETSQATLTWRYGDIQQAGTTAPATFAATDYAGWYCRVTSGPLQWYGIIVEDSDDRRGGSSGQQTLVAWGLETLLDFAYVESSRVNDAAASGVIEVGRPIPFNIQAGSDRKAPNRSTAVGPDAVYVFDSTTADEYWNARQIIDYLFEYYPPRDASGNELIPFSLAGPAISALEAYTPELDVSQSFTLRDILHTLIDRRRGLGWRLSIDTSGNPVVEVFSYSQTTLTLPGGTGYSLPANANLRTLSTASNVWIQRENVRFSAVQQVDQIVVRSERMGAVFTISKTDDTLDKDWTTAQQDEYNDGASNDAGYASLDRSERQDANENARAEERLHSVFRNFVIPSDWDATTKGGEDLFAPIPVWPDPESPFPELESDSLPHWYEGLRIDRTLPMNIGVDYSGNNVDNGTAIVANGSEFRTPLVAFELAAHGWQYAERLSSLADSDDAGEGGQDFSVAVRPRDDVAGLELTVDGERQHAIAADDFTGVPADEIWNLNNWPSWQNMMATVYVQADAYCQAVYPDPPTSGDVLRQLVLDIPGYHLDWLPENTVTHLKYGQPQRSSYGAWLRDDREELENLARLAWEWYGVTRQALTVSIQASPQSLFEVGHLITSLDGEPINTVITKVIYDLQGGTITAETQYANLDVLAFA